MRVRITDFLCQFGLRRLARQHGWVLRRNLRHFSSCPQQVINIGLQIVSMCNGGSVPHNRANNVRRVLPLKLCLPTRSQVVSNPRPST